MPLQFSQRRYLHMQVTTQARFWPAIFNSLTRMLIYWCLGLAVCISPLALAQPHWLSRGRCLLLVPGIVLFLASMLTLIVHIEPFKVIAA